MYLKIYPVAILVVDPANDGTLSAQTALTLQADVDRFSVEISLESVGAPHILGPDSELVDALLDDVGRAS
jgi:hypothetical protein